ncbi:hypothetical protein [Brochothrix campestris]|uniref:Uncharacterized protein n=1 Tax=Brochothrix campestris FSL F6-1037 TaxID=1265861 RepID=W7CRX4_9LIST|nr:hypothetical protein [Brochothrix campestris]EUJ35763.1 hypothetical protein BCAMP_11385 [Brochothrix campestris FSL F6-1037]
MKLDYSETCISTTAPESYDFDRYNFEYRTGLSTKECSITIDFKNNEIRGDMIAYGSWWELEVFECFPYLEFVLENKQSRRSFEAILDKL